jgi:SAM-dependent methyltransferase
MRLAYIIPLPIRDLLRPLVLPTRALVARAKVHARCLLSDVGDLRERMRGNWPSALLRYRVHGATDLLSYRKVGARCADDMVAAIQSAGEDPSCVRSVLDFGAGCGRTLHHLMPQLGRAAFAACDIDAPSVHWARRHLPQADWHHTKDLPPLPFSSESFDVVYAISVFTHMDEARQLVWMPELRRVTRRGGLIVFTVHGGAAAFRPLAHLNWKGLFPGWYLDVLHSEDYVRTRLSQGLSVVGWLPRGMNGHQDVVLLRRPAGID